MEDIKAAVEARVKAEEEALGGSEKKDDGITAAFIYACLNANERGDGALFAALNRGQFIFNKTSSSWFAWNRHHWRLDVLEKVFQSVEQVSDKYLDEAEKLSEKIKEAATLKEADRVKKLQAQQEAFFKRVKRLRSVAGAQACLTWSHRVEEALSIRGEEFDRNPWLLACSNGVIELDTGRCRPGRPDDVLIKAVPHDWQGEDCPAPNWEQFLLDVFAGDTELIGYVQRLFGYGITGLATEHILPVLYGAGRNGKGTLVETLRYVLDELAQPIQSEMLLDQRSSRGSSGPSPDIMSLKGLRIAFASETDEGRKFSTSKAKWLSGGDTLTGRNPHDKYETTFAPTHLLCLLTNHLPHAPGDDFAFWQRIHLVPFNIQFVDKPTAENERPKDKGLPERLKAEASGILAWLVRGCIEWQRQGLNPPEKVRSATEQYRFSEDILAEFIQECCEGPEDTDPDSRVQFKEVYEAFEAWFTRTRGDYPPKKKKFSQLMEKKFRKEKKGSHIWFYGLTLKPVEDRGE